MSLKNTEGNPAHDPSQNEMGCSLFSKTTIIQATGCNFRVSKERETTERLPALCDIARKWFNQSWLSLLHTILSCLHGPFATFNATIM